MSSRYRFLLYFASLMLAMVGSAHATERTIKIPAGKSWIIFAGGRIDPVTCKTEDPVNGRIKVLRQPSHGTTADVMQTIPFKSAGGTHACEGKPMQAHVLVYTPAKGFRGTDSVLVESMTYAYFREMYDPLELHLVIE